MTCKCSPSLLLLRDQVNAQYPNRDTTSDGCCGDAAHQARKSDHNPDASGYAHAYDIDEDIVADWGDKPLWEFGIRLLTDPRVKYLIYERHLMYPDGTDKPYTGINPHNHHLHVSIKAGTEHDTRPWPPIPPRAPSAATQRRTRMLLIRLKGDTGVWCCGLPNGAFPVEGDDLAALEAVHGKTVEMAAAGFNAAIKAAGGKVA